MTIKLNNNKVMKRTAKAQWTGSAKEGKGELTTQSGILNQTNYSFKTRFTGEEKGTNPEELLAAAHAGCFTMAVSFALTEKGLTPTLLNTEATLTMEGFAISGIHLSITGSVPGISEEEFTAVTKAAEQNCLISKALSIQITSDAQLFA
ncbi:osmotically inducible protein OsmC [Flavobacterium sp. 2755]|jgi:osmotically inducible protein OsmC|uniref:OsmC family peroxiredoxin n=1 Tax=Flavobacterium sp. 2755 TaxID=2817765 RepID=UPI002859522A|nr:OsmC family peroxiredoxin [Flavobacterium sp. 2755]MDR6762740.1 osmotically inducible protein OsmC [Flavobacterium sp. 2755]